MQQVNRYFRFAKISEARFRHLLRCFALDLSATQTAKMTGISVRSVNPIFQRLREKLAQECEKISPFSGDLEADESYFGPHRVRGKRGRGAARKTIVFGLLKRDDKVYTQIMSNLSRAALQAVIRNHASFDSRFTRTVGVATTAWLIWATHDTFASITGTTNLPSE
jgi:hypothetical protein